MIKKIHLAVTLVGESDAAFPAGDVLAQGIYDGIPKEWYDDNIADYAISSIVGTDEAQWDAQEKRLVRMDAELVQEKRLTAHLDEQVVRLAKRLDLIEPMNQDRIIENLTEKNDNQVTIIDAQRTRIHGLIGDADQRNDVVAGLRDELAAVDTELSNVKGKYDDSLLDWKVAIKERDDAINRADRNYAALEQQGTVADDETARADRLATDLKGCQKANRTYMGMNKAQATAIDAVKGAMQTLGYTFAFEESFDDLKAALGGIRQYIDDASSEVGIAEQELSNIETER